MWVHHRATPAEKSVAAVEEKKRGELNEHLECYWKPKQFPGNLG